MWIILNNAFFSIVRNRNNQRELLVRARVKGDIEKIFPRASVFEDNYADYKYRSFIDREIVARTVSRELSKINYDNFKNSVSRDDNLRLQAYHGVWNVLNRLQAS